METATRICFTCSTEQPLDDKHFVATTRPAADASQEPAEPTFVIRVASEMEPVPAPRN